MKRCSSRTRKFVIAGSEQYSIETGGVTDGEVSLRATQGQRNRLKTSLLRLNTYTYLMVLHKQHHCANGIFTSTAFTVNNQCHIASSTPYTDLSLF
ncbi:hypothetical protein E2C01_056409 [Portunus trituberculatus]|uniref:Uncharacterized protein n=1 Tax=Portunus trituberculatus TaxID=210409 RepID=A0A5B7GY36_PORTR|nr:hypothetical protein [Portunus trituberculatus]